MREEILKSITDAESQATEIRAAAVEKAAAIVAAATERAATLETAAADACKTYRETQLQAAHADAEQEYLASIQQTKTAAERYCVQALEGSAASVAKIVRRVSGVNR